MLFETLKKGNALMAQIEAKEELLLKYKTTHKFRLSFLNSKNDSLAAESSFTPRVTIEWNSSEAKWIPKEIPLSAALQKTEGRLEKEILILLDREVTRLELEILELKSQFEKLADEPA